MSNICWFTIVEDSKKRSRDDEVVEKKKNESKSSKKMRKSGHAKTSSLTLYFSSYDHDNNVRGSKGYDIM